MQFKEWHLMDIEERSLYLSYEKALQALAEISTSQDQWASRRAKRALNELIQPDSPPNEPDNKA